MWVIKGETSFYLGKRGKNGVRELINKKNAYKFSNKKDAEFVRKALEDYTDQLTWEIEPSD